MSLKKRLERKFPALSFEVGDICGEALIAEAQLETGVKFPADFVEYLREFGWLSIEHLEFFGLGEQIPKFLNLKVMAAEEWDSGGLDRNYLPIWNNGGGDLDCIDLQLSTASKSVICSIYHDTKQVEKVSDDFETWLCEKLTALHDDEN
jgi:hypothetical protein